MNNTFYGKPEELPFDLKTKRVFNYFYNDINDKIAIKKQIVSGLKKAIILIKDDPDEDPPFNSY